MELWGLKTVAWFDIWSLEHFLTGVSIGALVHFWHKGKISEKNHRYVMVIFVLFLAYFWEALEHYLEADVLGIDIVDYWLQGVEFWGNRLITDPMFVVLGHLAAVRFGRIVWPARVISLIFVILHLFVFPHCMYLHEIF